MPTRYRLALAVTTQEMPDVAEALRAKFPQLAQAVEAQWWEITNSGVNVFGPYQHDASEPIAGLSPCEIVLMTGVKD